MCYNTTRNKIKSANKFRYLSSIIYAAKILLCHEALGEWNRLRNFFFEDNILFVLFSFFYFLFVVGICYLMSWMFERRGILFKAYSERLSELRRVRSRILVVTIFTFKGRKFHCTQYYNYHLWPYPHSSRDKLVAYNSSKKLYFI